jgi:protein-disulfide isomerase
MNATRTVVLVIVFSAVYLSWNAAKAFGAPSAHQRRLDANPTANIKTDPRMCIGDEQAPVVLTLYACGRSEVCAKLIPSLYYDVSAGPLKGKVRMCFRPFFPSAQEDASACGRALVAAASQGMFWPYLLHLYYHNEDFQMCMLTKWADLKGLDRDAFEIAYQSSSTTELLAESRREGIANKVTRIPSAFINGQKVLCGISVKTLFDLLEEEYARVSPNGTAVKN